MQHLKIPSVAVYFSGSVESLSRVNRLFTMWIGCCCILGYVKVVCSIIWICLVFSCLPLCATHYSVSAVRKDF